MKAIEALRAAHLQHLRNTYKAVPDEELQSIAKLKKWSDKTANGLTNMVVSYITFIGGFCSRTQSQGGMRKDKFSGKMIRMKSTTKRGLADVTGVLNACALSIEVKVGKDKQSDKQKEVETQVNTAGGFYFISKDFATTYQWLQDAIINRKQSA